MSFPRDAGAWLSGMEESLRCKVKIRSKEKRGEAGPSYRKGRGRSRQERLQKRLELSLTNSLCLVSALTLVSSSASQPPSPEVSTSRSALFHLLSGCLVSGLGLTLGDPSTHIWPQTETLMTPQNRITCSKGRKSQGGEGGSGSRYIFNFTSQHFPALLAPLGLRATPGAQGLLLP